VARDDEKPAELSFVDRDRRAWLWEHGADERERLADERERLADEREALADERDRLADAHERRLDRRARDWSGRHSDDAIEHAEAEAAIERAEASVARAEAELARAKEAAERVAARAALGSARADRVDAAQRLGATTNDEEFAWLADRRDFVAADRETSANDRDMVADLRDDKADKREHQADKREKTANAREQLMDDRAGKAMQSDQQLVDHARQRSRRDQRRQVAATERRRSAGDRNRLAQDWGSPTYGPMLMASFGELARELLAFERPEELLHQVLKFTVGAVPGCDYASVTLWRDAHVVETAASHAIAAELDETQFGTGAGPTLQSLHSADPVHVQNLDSATAWPLLAAAARDVGVASALSHALFVRRSAQWSSQGTFTLYGTTPDAFTTESQEFVSVIAAYLSVAVAVAQRRHDLDQREAALHRALSTRDVIGQAKGILMERQRLSAGEAFDLLRRASQRLNVRVADVAQKLAETGQLPE
jgi:hypothetical protein